MNMVLAANRAKNEELIRLSALDHMLDRHYQMYFYNQPLNSGRLAAKLAVLADELPEIAGRLVERDGALYILNNNAGIPFEVSDIPHPVPDYGYGKSLDDVADLYVNKKRGTIAENDALLSIKVSNFSCGSSVLGISFSHLLCDAVGWIILLSNWSGLCRENKLLQKMDSDRGKLRDLCGYEKVDLPTEENEFVYFQNRFVENKIGDVEKAENEYKIFKISAECLRGLKARYVESVGGGAARASTQDLLTAKIWKCIVESQNYKGIAMLGTSYNIRGKVPVSILENFFPNATVYGAIKCDSEKMVAYDIFRLAETIRDAAALNTSVERISRQITYLDGVDNADRSKIFVHKGILGALADGAAYLNLGRYSSHGFDFGSGAPYLVGGEYKGLGRSFLIIPSIVKGDDSLFLHLTLHKREMGEFLSIMDRQLFFDTDMVHR